VTCADLTPLPDVVVAGNHRSRVHTVRIIDCDHRRSYGIFNCILFFRVSATLEHRLRQSRVPVDRPTAKRHEAPLLYLGRTQGGFRFTRVRCRRSRTLVNPLLYRAYLCAGGCHSESDRTMSNKKTVRYIFKPRRLLLPIINHLSAGPVPSSPRNHKASDEIRLVFFYASSLVFLNEKHCTSDSEHYDIFLFCFVRIIQRQIMAIYKRINKN